MIPSRTKGSIVQTKKNNREKKPTRREGKKKQQQQQKQEQRLHQLKKEKTRCLAKMEETSIDI